MFLRHLGGKQIGGGGLWYDRLQQAAGELAQAVPPARPGQAAEAQRGDVLQRVARRLEQQRHEQMGQDIGSGGAFIDAGWPVQATSLPKQAFDDAATVHSYKSLAFVERAFRCIKTVDLQVRPVYRSICHRMADRVRAHVFLCMLAYYGAALTGRGSEAHDRTDPGRAAGPQFPIAAGRSGNRRPQHRHRLNHAQLSALRRHQAQPPSSTRRSNSSASVVASSAGLARAIVLPNQ